MLLLRYCVTSKSCPKPLAHVIPCCILIVPIFFTSNRSIFLYIWNKLSFFQPIFVQFIHAFVAVLCDKQVMSTAPGACEHVFSRGRAAIWSARRVMASTEMHMQNAGYFSKPASRMVSCFCYLVRVTDSTSRVFVRDWRDSGLEGLLALFFAFVVCTCSGGVVRYQPGDLGRCLLSLGPGGISNVPVVHVVYTAFRHSCGTYGVVKRKLAEPHVSALGFSPAVSVLQKVISVSVLQISCIVQISTV